MDYLTRFLCISILASGSFFGTQTIAEDLIGEIADPAKDLNKHVVRYLDGEEYNALSGEMGYYINDINIEGNGLPIQLGRRFRPEYGYPYQFDTMSLETPRIEYRHLGKLTYQTKREYREDVPDYSKPATGVNQCAGLKMYGLGVVTEPDLGRKDEPDYWAYSHSDLSAGIRLYLQGKAINFFPVEGIQTTARFPAVADYVSPDNWYIDCAGTKWVAKSPAGLTYTFLEYEHVYAGQLYSGEWDWSLDNRTNLEQAKATVYVSKIEDRYGNALTYNYDGHSTNMVIGNGRDGLTRAFTQKRLRTITANDGRSVLLTYSANKITRIVDNGVPNATDLDFTYRTSGSDKGLAKVIRPDGTFWEYHYARSLANAFDGAGGITVRDRVGISLSKITTPSGLSIIYSQLAHYQWFHSDLADSREQSPPFSSQLADTRQDKNFSYRYSSPAYGRSFKAALRQRTVSGSNIPAGMTWHYSYYKLASGNKAATFIIGPTSNLKFTYRRRDLNRSPQSASRDSGRLLESAIYPAGTSFSAANATTALKKTVTSWIQSPSIVNQSTINGQWRYYNSDRYRPTAVWWSSYHVADNIRPGTVTTTLDGHTFTKTYSNFDSFDNIQQLVETGNAGTRTTTFSYHNDSSHWIVGQRKSETVSGGGPGIVRSFNTLGRLATEQQYGLSAKTYSYHATGSAGAGELSQISWLRDGLPLTQQFQDYYRGIPRSEIDPEGGITARTINSDGTVASMTDPNGKVTDYTYDNLHRVDSANGPLYASSNTDWGDSNRTRTTTQGNLRITENFDALGRPIKASQIDLADANNNAETLTNYDKTGRVIYQSLPKTTTSASIGYQYTYDSLSRVKTLTHTGDNSTTTYCYQVANCGFATGKLSFGYAMTDPRGFYTVHNFEAYGDTDDRRLINIHDTTGTSAIFNRETAVNRNLYGDITSITRGSTERTYDYSTTMPRLIHQVTEPETGLTSYQYRSDGTLKSTQTATSGVTEYGHDNNGRVISINYPGATPDVTNSYYPNGELKTSATDGTLWNYILNTENDLSQEILGIDSLTLATRYTYDNLGNTKTIQYPSGRTIIHGNDALGRTRNISTYINATRYYPNGQLSAITFGNGQVTSITQSNKHYPELLKTERNGNTLVDMTYAYDKNNNITSITNPKLGNKTLGYDGVNRLISATGPWGTDNTNTIYTGSISYDHNDNITQKTMGAHSLGYVYDATSNRLTGTTGSKVYAFEYDLYGNVTNNGIKTFNYNDANQLKTSGSNSYRYDVHNRRVKTTKGTVNQYYVYTSNGRLMHRYNAGSKQTTDYIYLAGKQIAKHDQKPDPLQATTAPVFWPAGGTHTESVIITLSTTPPSANPSIRYTTDGSAPTINSTAYTGPFTLTSNTTLKSKVIGADLIDSPLTTSTFTIKSVAASISPNGGTHIDSVNVTLNSPAQNEVIYYTTDGSTPTTGSTHYKGSFNITNSGSLKTIATVTGNVPSAVSSAAFTITRIAAPRISPGGGTHTKQVAVSMSTTVSGGIIRYTTNGSTPTSSSTQYTGAFNLTSSANVNTRTFLSGKRPSDVASSYFAIKATTPKIRPVSLAGVSIQNANYYRYSVSGGRSFNFGVKISNSSTAPIYYTTNGSTPTTGSNRYTGPFNIHVPECGYFERYVKARAIGGGGVSGNVASTRFYLRSYGKPCN